MTLPQNIGGVKKAKKTVKAETGDDLLDELLEVICINDSFNCGYS
jgi:hypothetical protein